MGLGPGWGKWGLETDIFAHQNHIIVLLCDRWPLAYPLWDPVSSLDWEMRELCLFALFLGEARGDQRKGNLLKL